MFKDKDLCLLLKILEINIGNGRKIFDKSIDVSKSMKKNMVKKY